MTMTVDEVREHALRIREDLEHKRREIRRREFHPYDRATLVRQCAALSDRLDEILRELDEVERTQRGTEIPAA